MIEKVLKQQYVDIWPIPFQNDDPINDQLYNTGIFLNQPLLIKVLHKDSLKIHKLFLYVKTGNGILEKTQNMINIKMGTCFTPLL